MKGNPSEGKAYQLPENTQISQGYKSVGPRRKLDLVRKEPRPPCETFLPAEKIQGQFAHVFKSQQKTSRDHKLMKALAKDYAESIDKESSKLIWAQGANESSKLLIGKSTKGSNLNVVRSRLGQGKTHIETARAVGQISKYGHKWRRLLSIVAQDFSMS